MSTERLLHYSATPIDHLEPRAYEQDPRSFKPTGLWVSVEGESDWKGWCEGEDFHLDSLACVHVVQLAEDANILRLTTAEDILAFTDEFGRSIFERPIPKILERSIHAIDWPLVASRWQGIIIAPYCWRLRMHDRTSWYYAWDCASGCIWDLSAIRSIELIKEAE